MAHRRIHTARNTSCHAPSQIGQTGPSPVENAKLGSGFIGRHPPNSQAIFPYWHWLTPTPKKCKAALLAGANDYLITPVDPDELMLRPRSLLSIRDLHLTNLATYDRLHDEVAARAEKLDMLIQNGLLMAQTYERSELIRHTLFEGRRLLHCDAASMCLVTEKKTLRFVMRTRDDTLASYEIALYNLDT